MKFYAEKDLALCGLACVLCSDEACPGCKARGCREGGDCSVYWCASGKGLDGCYQCDAFPCDEKMLRGTRNRAFNRYARQFGKRALLDRLQINHEDGVVYHRSGGLTGDYDLPSDEKDILRLIRFGTHDPYIRCPVLESAHFILRLVRLEDAGELLGCYSDPKAREIFNADKCTSDFRYRTLEEMQSCIQLWLSEYQKKTYIRFSVDNKQSEKAVGTVEMFESPQGFGVLRLDLASPYEKRLYVEELLTLCVSSFYGLFDVERIVTKALPAAEERVAALHVAGFAPYDWQEPGRGHYWAHNKE